MNANRLDLLTRMESARYAKNEAKRKVAELTAALDVQLNELRNATAQERHYRAQLKASL